MIRILTGLLGRDFDLGRVTVTEEMVARYVRAVGDPLVAAGPLREAPPTFCLAMVRIMTPTIELPPDVFSMYGGHDVEFHRPIRVGETYQTAGRFVDVYEKVGRSGVLTVVAREVVIREHSGTMAVRIAERQIIRQRPPSSMNSTTQRLNLVPPFAERDLGWQATADRNWGVRGILPAPALPKGGTLPGELDLGHELGPRQRQMPGPEAIAEYARTAGIVEPLFSDAEWARALGFDGVVVAGPMLAAFLEHFVRAELPGWQLERSSTTFRVPTTSGELIILTGVVTERHEIADGERTVCDLLIEHRDGEQAATGTATLRQALRSQEA